MANKFKLGNKKNASDIVKQAMGKYAQSRLISQRASQQPGTQSGMSLGQFGNQMFQSFRDMRNPEQRGMSWGRQLQDGMRNGQSADYMSNNPNWRNPAYMQPSTPMAPPVYQQSPATQQAYQNVQQQLGQGMSSSPGFRDEPMISSPGFREPNPQQFQQPMISSPGFRDEPMNGSPALGARDQLLARSVQNKTNAALRKPAGKPLDPRKALIKQRATAQRKNPIMKPTNPNIKSM